MTGDRPLALLLLTGLAFGCNFPLGRLAMAAGVNPALWAAVICLGAGAAVLTAAQVLEPSQTAPGIWRYAILSSLISNVIPLTLTFAVIAHIGSGLTAIVVATSPITTALISLVLGVRPPTRWGLAGIGVGLAGACLIATAQQGGPGGGWSPYLVMAALIPLFLGAGNVFRTLAWPPGAGPLRLGGLINLAAVAPLLAIAWAWGGLDPAPLAMIPGLVAAQLLAATIMYLLLFRLQAAGGPTYLSQIGYVAAAFAAVIGVAFLGERYPPMVWVGAGVVAAGIAITTLARAREG